MQKPVQVAFRGMKVSDAVEAACWEEAAKLERYFDRMTGCRVVIAEPHRQHRKGNLFEVRIDLTVPGGEIVVTREPPAHHADEDVFVALRDAFDTARRRLEDFARRRRGQVKAHEPQARGRVARLFQDDGYGFIEDDDGRELYFHRNSVLGDGFGRLAIGTTVRFAEEEGDKGPQASSVIVLEGQPLVTP
ncbi:MAG: HPF/RaiA family ribosome-associated protein [Planctomycetota bacterium]|jgi:cold shock CspA family protein